MEDELNISRMNGNNFSHGKQKALRYISREHRLVQVKK